MYLLTGLGCLSDLICPLESCKSEFGASVGQTLGSMEQAGCIVRGLKERSWLVCCLCL